VTGSAPGELAGKTVGVIGGMGPFATADFLHKLISATPAERDQDHMRILVDCNPGVPDRTEFLAGRGPDPRPVLRVMTHCLVRAGADFAIYGPAGVKRAGAHSAPARADLIAAAASVLEQGADALLLACTEFSALHAIAPLELGIPVVDAAESVARYVVSLATQTCQHARQATS
jgi:aspartate/glutamate racemase